MLQLTRPSTSSLSTVKAHVVTAIAAAARTPMSRCLAITVLWLSLPVCLPHSPVSVSHNATSVIIASYRTELEACARLTVGV